MQKFRFNDRFSRLIRDTSTLFSDIVQHKQRFNALNYTAFMAYAVASKIRRTSRCVAIRHRKKINRLRQHYRAEHHRTALSGVVQRRFAHGVPRHRHYTRIIDYIVRNALESAEDLERFARRVEEAYRHFLFECYVAATRGGIVELLCIARDLIVEADTVIQQDARFRHDIVRSSMHLPRRRSR